MRRDTGLLVALAAGLIALGADAPRAAAQGPMTCSPANVGQAVCQAQGVCKCTYNAGGTMFREPPGYRWDCSLLYGKCEPGSAYPALAMTTVPGPVPPGGTVAVQMRAVQAELTRRGFNPGPVDGVMGPRTAAAIRAFQRAQHLPETGTVTPETYSRLRIAG